MSVAFLCSLIGFKPLSDESVANIANHEVEMLENGRRGREIEIIHLSYGQAEIDQLVVAAVETGQNGIYQLSGS